MRRALALVALSALLAVHAAAQMSVKNGVPLIVPGSELGWEVDALRLVVRVEEPGEVEILLYSPGFDPRDYRSENELGDERYDGGKGELVAEYRFLSGDTLLASARFGVEPHRWVRLYRGVLAPGEYVILARFQGNGKNAVVFKVVSRSGRARLLLSPREMQTYNVVRNGWQTPFTLELPEPSPGARVGIYDGDGPQELEFRVETPSGTRYPPVPGDREWYYLELGERGRYAFAFRIPPTAKQHTNTIGIRLFPGKIEVTFVDTEGRPVPGAGYRLLGEYVREVVPEVPEGWRIVRVVPEGGRLVEDNRVRFGLGRGRVRYVLDRVRGRVALSARAACGPWQAGVALRLRLGGREVRVPVGGTTLELPPGRYPLAVAPVPGAAVSAPAAVEVSPGAVSELFLEVRPRVRLFLDAPDAVRAGEAVPVRIRVETDYPNEVPVRVRLVTGPNLRVQGKGVWEARVRAGTPWEHRVMLDALAPGTARLKAEVEPCPGKAEVALNVLPPPRPDADLTRQEEPKTLLPGETVRICFQVRSRGDATLRYRLRDRVPEWLEPLEAPEFAGELEPGEERAHCYRARVRSGPPATGRLRAVLTSNAGEREAIGELQRVSLGLTKSVEPTEVLLGESARFTVSIENPLERAVRVRLVEQAEPGLGIEGGERELELAPGERRELTFEARPRRVGTLRNRAEVYLENMPVAPPATATLRVRPPETEARVSEVRVTFRVDRGEGTYLLLRHLPPEGARYRLGTSRLDGVPVDDPRWDEDGYLYWKLPFQREGVLSYVLEHEGPLPRLPEPELSLLFEERALPLAGRVTLDRFEAARPLRPGVLRGPRVRVTDQEEIEIALSGPAEIERDGLRVGKLDAPGRIELPLDPGANRLVLRSEEGVEELVVYRSGPPVEVALTPLQAVADGRSPLVFGLEFRDRDGNPAALDRATVEADPEPLDPDLDPGSSGYQVAVTAGRATLRLKPMTTPGRVRIRVALGESERELVAYVRGPDRTDYLVQGSITARVYPGFAVGGLSRGYLETPLAEGYLQAAMDLTYSDGALHGGLGDPEDPTRRFPLTGSGEEAELPLISDDGVAFRYDRGPFSLGYGRVPAGYTALYLEHRGLLELRAHGGLVARTRVTDRIRPDGSRIYQLAYPAQPGSEVVYLERGGRRVRLERFRDYSLDPLSGTLYLARSLWPVDDALNPQVLVVEYAPIAAPRDAVALGLDAGYRWGPFGLRASLATRDLGRSLEYALELRYRAEELAAALNYRRASGGNEAGFTANGRTGPYRAEVNLSYGDTLTGWGRLAAELTREDRMALEHEGNQRQNETRLLYERVFESGIVAGLGVGYRWEAASVSGLARAGLERDGVRLNLTHSQPFRGPARTSLRASRQLDPNLTLNGDVAYVWGQGLEGVLQLDQRLGDANLTLAYRLPGASGEGNRARFGVRAPWPLSPDLALDLNAGASYDLNRAEHQLGLGVGLRYRNAGLVAGFGVDGAVGSYGAKLGFRGGAAGVLDDRQALSVDAGFQLLPELRGRFTAAYAYRGEGLQVLTYHRYRTDPEEELEGELAAAWHPTLSFQLRPSAAYRVRFQDPMANTYQIGLGLNRYFTRRFGLGGGVYYVWQPGTGRDALAYSLEGSFRLVDPIWLNLGYTFGGFEGLTPESQPGVYLRVDFFGGSLDR